MAAKVREGILHLLGGHVAIFEAELYALVEHRQGWQPHGHRRQGQRSPPARGPAAVAGHRPRAVMAGLHPRQVRAGGVGGAEKIAQPAGVPARLDKGEPERQMQSVLLLDVAGEGGGIEQVHLTQEQRVVWLGHLPPPTMDVQQTWLVLVVDMLERQVVLGPAAQRGRTLLRRDHGLVGQPGGLDQAVGDVDAEPATPRSSQKRRM